MYIYIYIHIWYPFILLFEYSTWGLGGVAYIHMYIYLGSKIAKFGLGFRAQPSAIICIYIYIYIYVYVACVYIHKHILCSFGLTPTALSSPACVGVVALGDTSDI